MGLKRLLYMGAALVAVVAVIAGMLLVGGGDDNSDEGTTDTTRSAVAIGVFINLPDTPSTVVRPFVVSPLSEALAQYGYIEGENLTILFATPYQQTLEEAAQSLIDGGATVLFPMGGDRISGHAPNRDNAPDGIADSRH